MQALLLQPAGGQVSLIAVHALLKLLPPFPQLYFQKGGSIGRTADAVKLQGQIAGHMGAKIQFIALPLPRSLRKLKVNWPSLEARPLRPHLPTEKPWLQSFGYLNQSRMDCHLKIFQ